MFVLVIYTPPPKKKIHKEGKLGVTNSREDCKEPFSMVSIKFSK